MKAMDQLHELDLSENAGINGSISSLVKLSEVEMDAQLVRAAVNIMGSRALFRVDIGFYMELVLRPLIKSLYRIHALLVNQEY